MAPVLRLIYWIFVSVCVAVVSTIRTEPQDEVLYTDQEEIEADRDLQMEIQRGELQQLFQSGGLGGHVQDFFQKLRMDDDGPVDDFVNMLIQWGGLYPKLAQRLRNDRNIVPSSKLRAALGKIMESNKAMPSEVIISHLVANMNVSAKDVKFIRTLGTGSVAQVVLVEISGEEKVMKMTFKEVENQFKKDFIVFASVRFAMSGPTWIVQKFTGLSSAEIEAFRAFLTAVDAKKSPILDEFNLDLEFGFTNEGTALVQNCWSEIEHAYKYPSLRGYKIRVPTVTRHNSNLLEQELAGGESLEEIARNKSAELTSAVEAYTQGFLPVLGCMLMYKGKAHGDAHAGNLRYDKATKTLWVIDWGALVIIDEEQRKGLSGIVTELDLGEVTSLDNASFKEAERMLVGEHLGSDLWRYLFLPGRYPKPASKDMETVKRSLGKPEIVLCIETITLAAGMVRALQEKDLGRLKKAGLLSLWSPVVNMDLIEQVDSIRKASKGFSRLGLIKELRSFNPFSGGSLDFNVGYLDQGDDSTILNVAIESGSLELVKIITRERSGKVVKKAELRVRWVSKRFAKIRNNSVLGGRRYRGQVAEIQGTDDALDAWLKFRDLNLEFVAISKLEDASSEEVATFKAEKPDEWWRYDKYAKIRTNSHDKNAESYRGQVGKIIRSEDDLEVDLEFANKTRSGKIKFSELEDASEEEIAGWEALDPHIMLRARWREGGFGKIPMESSSDYRGQIGMITSAVHEDLYVRLEFENGETLRTNASELKHATPKEIASWKGAVEARKAARVALRAKWVKGGFAKISGRVGIIINPPGDDLEVKLKFADDSESAWMDASNLEDASPEEVAAWKAAASARAALRAKWVEGVFAKTRGKVGRIIDPPDQDLQLTLEFADGSESAWTEASKLEDASPQEVAAWEAVAAASAALRAKWVTGEFAKIRSKVGIIFAVLNRRGGRIAKLEFADGSRSNWTKLSELEDASPEEVETWKVAATARGSLRAKWVKGGFAKTRGKVGRISDTPDRDFDVRLEFTDGRNSAWTEASKLEDASPEEVTAWKAAAAERDR